MTALAVAAADGGSSEVVLVLGLVVFVLLVRLVWRLVGWLAKTAALVASLAGVVMAVGGLGGLATLTLVALR
ncbi:hypothetical protein ACWEOE_36360 [Amycolatopsis sp. NPDC004368]